MEKFMSAVDYAEFSDAAKQLCKDRAADLAKLMAELGPWERHLDGRALTTRYRDVTIVHELVPGALWDQCGLNPHWGEARVDGMDGEFIWFHCFENCAAYLLQRFW